MFQNSQMTQMFQQAMNMVQANPMKVTWDGKQFEKLEEAVKFLNEKNARIAQVFEHEGKINVIYAKEG